MFYTVGDMTKSFIHKTLNDKDISKEFKKFIAKQKEL